MPPTIRGVCDDTSVTTGTGPAERRRPRQLSAEEQALRTARWIDECKLLEDMRASVENQFPEMTTAQVDLFFAQLVIRNNLGEDWVERNIDAASEGIVRRNNTSTYLRRSPVNLMERHERYVRVMELARRLFELGQEDFAERLHENLRRRDLEGAAFEADVVRMLVSLPVVVELREESGVKGDDYDIDLWLTRNTAWAVEAKTRMDSSPYSVKRLHKTLDRARSQLPPNWIGGIFLKVPTPWTTDSDYTEYHAADVAAFLRQTSRVHLIVLVWDVWTPRSSGKGWSWDRACRIFKSPRINPHLSNLADGYQRIWENPHDLIAPNAPF